MYLTDHLVFLQNGNLSGRIRLSDITNATEIIQTLVAPAVMITGVALLLLTFNARHSSLVNRIRLLDEEKRHLYKVMSSSKAAARTETLRLKSIRNQLNLLLPRLAYLRNGMLCQTLAAMFFVLTSFSIGLTYFSVPPNVTQVAIHVTFISGMCLVLVGIAFLALEIFVSYRVIVIEAKQEERQ